jgi:pyrroline-5-carboxylate reductase
MDYGVIGVGAIAEAIVIGCCDGVEAPPSLMLSPRNAAKAHALAERYTTVAVAPDNQAVLDGAPVVLLCVRPQVARETLAGLRFRPDQVVISLIAGITIDELGEIVAPATEIVRCIPLPSVARRADTTPIHPPHPVAKALFARLGEPIDVPDARAFDGFAVASATVAAHFAYLRAISEWLEPLGIARDDAQRYMAAVFAGLGPILERDHDFEHLARGHATVGGINEQFLRTLTEAGVYDDVRAGLDRVLARLSEL